LLLKTLRFLFAYNAWCVSARENRPWKGSCSAQRDLPALWR